ncbi:hypothetical protein D9M68_469230 [compost metagenome]
MNDCIDVAGQLEDRFHIAQVALNQFLVRCGFAHVGDIGQTQGVGQVSGLLAQNGTESASRAGDEDSVEFCH